MCWASIQVINLFDSKWQVDALINQSLISYKHSMRKAKKKNDMVAGEPCSMKPTGVCNYAFYITSTIYSPSSSSSTWISAAVRSRYAWLISISCITHVIFNPKGIINIIHFQLFLADTIVLFYWKRAANCTFFT